MEGPQRRKKVGRGTIELLAAINSIMTFRLFDRLVNFMEDAIAVVL